MSGRRTSPRPGRRATPIDALRRFLHDEAAGGVVLLAATAVAVAWANSRWAPSYVDLWDHVLTVGNGQLKVSEDLVGWVNDGLMAFFFFVVGLEIKRELVTGELRQPRAAVLPAVAALGGALLPALIFLSIAPPGDAARGWGVPMATDIAFAVGVLTLLGRQASAGAKLFLLSIAIVDDLLAIVVIAVFYSGSVHWSWLAVSMAILLVVLLMRRWFVSPWAYVLPAFVVWLSVLESGVHATLAGVALGLLTPARPVRGRAVLEDLERRLHPLSIFVVVPLFALANAGVDLRGGALTAALGERVTWAVAIGLVAGKTLGITATTFGLLHWGLGVLPTGMSRREVLPVAALGGIGFTVALFITDLAYSDVGFTNDAKVGVFMGSLAAAGLGAALLSASTRHRTGREPDQ